MHDWARQILAFCGKHSSQALIVTESSPKGKSEIYHIFNNYYLFLIIIM